MQRHRAVKLIVVSLAALACSVTAFSSTTIGDLQAMQIRELKMAAGLYRAQYGHYPTSDEDGTWFERLVELRYLPESWPEPRRGGFGTTPDGTLPLGAYGHPIIYELHPGLPGGDAVFRAIGRNGIDDNGALDDFDSRFGENLGYWNKTHWPALYRRAGLCALIAVASLAVLIPLARKQRRTRSLLFAVPGAVAAIVLPYGFDGGLGRTTASRLPVWIDTVAYLGALLIVAAVVIVIIDAQKLIVTKLGPKQGHCHRCGYDMRGSPTSICPECGTDQSPANG